MVRSPRAGSRIPERPREGWCGGGVKRLRSPCACSDVSFADVDKMGDDRQFTCHDVQEGFVRGRPKDAGVQDRKNKANNKNRSHLSQARTEGRRRHPYCHLQHTRIANAWTSTSHILCVDARSTRCLCL